MIRFETFDRMTVLGRRWFFRIVADGNNEILAQSQAYRSARARDNAVDLIGDWAGAAEIVAGKR